MTTDATGQVDGLTAGSVTEVYISEQGDGFADGDLIIFDSRNWWFRCIR